MNDKNAFLSLKNEVVLSEFKDVLKVTSHWMAVPLFLFFWGADLIYIPEKKWFFLCLRLIIVPLCIVTSFTIRKANNVQLAESIASFYSISLAMVINIMIFTIDDPGTLYYSGLNLVAIGCLSFLPFTRRFYIFTALGVYVPYYVIVLSQANSQENYFSIVLNSFFIGGTLTICFIIRFFHERTRMSELRARVSLNQELESRNQIIRSKTEEGIRLKALSAQFSPQIIENIRAGNLSLETGSSRSEICVIFVDIVGSTERVTILDKDKVEKVIGKFLDDTIKILLLYDLTIDKFMGDGVIAFCNAPQKRPDFISRVINAALDIRQKIDEDKGFYEKYWGQALGIRIGIAKGFVNVGFYGSQRHFRNYTAIGPALALASRLCAIAEPNQILIDLDVFERIEHEYNVKFVIKREIKGFQQGLIYIYEIINSLSQHSNFELSTTECPKCSASASFEQNDQGQLALYCRSCQEFISIKVDYLTQAS